MKLNKIPIYVILMLVLISSVYAGTTTGSIIYDEEINFNAGTYVSTYWNGSGVVLNNSLSGSYCSDVTDTEHNNTEWDSFNFISQSNDYNISLGGLLYDNVYMAYQFDSLSGTTLYDKSNFGNLALSGSGYNLAVSGFIGSGLYMTDTSSAIGTGNKIILSTDDTLTCMTFWTTSSVLTADMFTILDNLNNPMLSLQLASNGKIIARSWRGSVNGVLQPAGALDDGNVYNVCSYTDASTSNFVLYINGVNIANTNIGTMASRDFSKVVLGNNQYIGYLDEVCSFVGDFNFTSIINEYSVNGCDITQDYLEVNTSLDFKARSCDNTLCTGYNFSDILDISPVNLNFENNSYFQWCADYNSTNLMYSPELNYVNINFNYDTDINDTNVTINPVACNFKSEVVNMYYDYPYIERGVPTTLGWRIYKENEPSVVVGNVSEAKIFINDQWFNLTFNELNNNYEVTLFFNEIGDYYIDYPFKLFFKDDLSELCTLDWDNGYLKVRDFIDVDINLYTNSNLSKEYKDNFGFVYAEIINEEMSEVDMWSGLSTPIKLTNFWLDKAIVETTGVKLNIGEEENLILNKEKVYYTSLGLDGSTLHLRIPANEDMVLKIMGVNSNQAVQFLHEGYSHFWYLPDEVRYNSELTYLNYDDDTTLQIVVTDIDVNPNWYYFKMFLIIFGIILVLGIPFFTYMATADMGQAVKVFYYMIISVPAIITIVIFIGGFLR